MSTVHGRRTREVLDMLRRHYLPDPTRPGGVFAPEIAAPDSNRRADLVWLGVTAASGYRLVGHEIKASRGDLLAELAAPTKSDPWQRYCDRWWLVVADPDMLDGLDVPDTWGIMAPPSGRRTRSMTIVRDAPRLRPIEQGPAMRTLSTWLHWRLHDATQAHEHTRRELDRVNADNREMRQQGLGLGPNEQRRIDAIVQEVVTKLGGVPDYHGKTVGDYGSRVSVDDVVEALRDLGSVYVKATRVQATVEAAQRAVGVLAAAVEPDPTNSLEPHIKALRRHRRLE